MSALTKVSLPVQASEWLPTVYGAGVYILVAKNQDIVLTSSDALSWTASTLPTWAYPGAACAAFGGGVFVIVRADSHTFSSPDGVTWTQRGYAPGVNHLAYGAGKFAGTVSSGTSASYSADLGVSWTTNTSALSLSTWTDVSFVNDRFIAVNNVHAFAAVSTDGVAWSAATLPAAMRARSSFFLRGNYFIAGDGSVGPGLVRSGNGTDWETVSDAVFGTGYAKIATDGTKALACDRSPSGPRIIESRDGLTWRVWSLGDLAPGETYFAGDKFIFGPLGGLSALTELYVANGAAGTFWTSLKGTSEA